MKTLTQCQKATEPIYTGCREIRRGLYKLGSAIKAIRIPRRKKLKKRGLIPEMEFSPDVAALVLLTDVVVAILNIGNVFGFDVETEIARHFPNECGYCRKPMCVCHTLAQKPPTRFILPARPDWVNGMSIFHFQEMFWRIYPKTKTLLSLSKLTLHLAEEILELLEVLDVEGNPDRTQLVLESTDVMEKAFDIASLLGVNLSWFLEVRLGLTKLTPKTEKERLLADSSLFDLGAA